MSRRYRRTLANIARLEQDLGIAPRPAPNYDEMIASYFAQGLYHSGARVKAMQERAHRGAERPKD